MVNIFFFILPLINSLIQVNCETDFVAMNVEFKGLVAQALEAVMEKGKSQASNKVAFSRKQISLLQILFNLQFIN